MSDIESDTVPAFQHPSSTNQAAWVIASSYIFLTCSVLVIVVKLLTKLRVSRKLSLDDWLIVQALLCTLVHVAILDRLTMAISFWILCRPSVSPSPASVDSVIAVTPSSSVCLSHTKRSIALVLFKTLLTQTLEVLLRESDPSDSHTSFSESFGHASYSFL